MIRGCLYWSPSFVWHEISHFLRNEGPSRVESQFSDDDDWPPPAFYVNETDVSIEIIEITSTEGFWQCFLFHPPFDYILIRLRSFKESPDNPMNYLPSERCSNDVVSTSFGPIIRVP